MVDFNPELEAHLLEMRARRAPDSEWIFPSPQRGVKDLRAKTFRESLRAVRTLAALPTVGFHDMRHFFVSSCVMSGIDFMTVSTWVGHRDGGILIGKVYGHLVDTHRQKAAKSVNFQLST
jgi:integrase